MTTRGQHRLFSLSALLWGLFVFPIAEAATGCADCQRLFYEVTLNVSRPCDSPSESSSANIQSACVVIPSTLAASVTDPIVTRLEIYDLNERFSILSGQTVERERLRTGDTIFYESVWPQQTQGVQIIATAFADDDREQPIIHSIVIHFGNCFPTISFIETIVGWAQVRILCQQTQINDRLPSRMKISKQMKRTQLRRTL